MNVGLVRRARKGKCAVCDAVAAIEDVNGRLFDENGHRLPPKEAFAYLRGLGMGGSNNAMWQRIRHHAKHVTRDLANPPIVVNPSAVVPLEPDGTPGWVSTSRKAVAMAPEFLAELEKRAPDMDDKDFNTALRILMSQVTQQGNWSIKFRQLDQFDAVLEAASGEPPSEPDA